MNSYKIVLKVFSIDDNNLLLHSAANIPSSIDGDRLVYILKTGLTLAKMYSKIHPVSWEEAFDHVFWNLNAVEETRNEAIRLTGVKPEDQFDKNYRMEITV